jgi:hypothetical protein
MFSKYIQFVCDLCGKRKDFQNEEEAFEMVHGWVGFIAYKRFNQYCSTTCLKEAIEQFEKENTKVAPVQ